ncbi:glutamate dehydrogenase (NAD(P)+) [Rubritalea squalenifaciens DSM 18772]|uniref:Glutamate dehydrogenase n=1 Tax=Rubritalea squalenifaciens DSM 18772 TaxID=1123071 RepID=A0A1M6BJ87_9BACT|nr:Glu/Leu/Phe/Val dehydrogenase [Rubritalea squalenifaciens]SHI48779.1 glutamate dehydrogenase (NAD(P)+) [Rubritalea squalenifaciens DSM 18772]
MKEQLMAHPVFGMAARQFDRTADHLNLTEDVRERCKWPKRLITVTIPIKRDNGDTEVFFGYRVQHHLSRGPVKGGLRFHPNVELGEVAALSMWMNWKCALMELPFGGGKGGVTCDPRSMSQRELENVTRRYTSEMLPFIGPETDVMAPDMGTNEQTMAWMTDVYSTHAGHLVPGIVTGKPVNLQGSQGRTVATGHGVAFLATRALTKCKIKHENATAIVQGFGNVGSYAALTLSRFGVKVIGISDITGAIFNENGIKVEDVFDHVAANGGVKDFAGADSIDPDEMLVQKCDVLVPAALERVITEENAPKLQCRVLAEAANGPTTTQADAIIEERGDIFLVPDILCNAGGVTVSYFEWVQNLQRFQWSEQEVLTKLETMLAKAFDRVQWFADKQGVSNRVAALALGIKEVADVKKQRGLFP